MFLNNAIAIALAASLFVLGALITTTAAASCGTGVPWAICYPSPNFNSRTLTVNMIVLHYTATTDAKSLSTLTSTSSQVSSHYLIMQNGTTYQLVDEAKRAWHAGCSYWRGITNVNSASIGIEIVNYEDSSGKAVPYTEVQIVSIIMLCQDLIRRYNIPKENVVGHSDIVPPNKPDPGSHFPWQRLYENGIGHWVTPNPWTSDDKSMKYGSTGPAVVSLQKQLIAYGYGYVNATGTYDTITKDVVMAFQRHFRQVKCDGYAENSTVSTLNKLIEAEKIGFTPAVTQSTTLTKPTAPATTTTTKPTSTSTTTKATTTTSATTIKTSTRARACGTGALFTACYPSPNYNDRTLPVSALVMHFTFLDDRESLQTLTSSSSGVSAHYLVLQNGTVYQLVDEAKRAWHAGSSYWQGETNVNSESIGIEIVNFHGADGRLMPYTEQQIQSIILLSQDILRRYPIPPYNVIGHSDVAPLRKPDPGSHFPWRRLYENGIGHWVAPDPFDPNDKGLRVGSTGSAVSDLQAKLITYGYGYLNSTGSYDQNTRDVVLAFQQHFRQARCDGYADASTVNTLTRLINAVKQH